MNKEDENYEFLSALDYNYISDLYLKYLDKSLHVNSSWYDFFENLNDSEIEIIRDISGTGNKKPFNGQLYSTDEDISNDIDTENLQDEIKRAASDSVKAIMLIRAYRVRGHMMANLDPLKLKEVNEYPELDPAHHGFSIDDYDRKIFLNGSLGFEYATLRQILSVLKRTYCGSIGVEYMHLTDPEQKTWIQQRIENIGNRTNFTAKGKLAILQKITAAEMFEKFLHKKYPGTKRFGIDGAETLIPALEQIIKKGGHLGLTDMVIGMAHRGRLNVLSNVMGKPYSTIFAEFRGEDPLNQSVMGSGDVKYHLGVSGDREFDGNKIHISLTANPSHLEAVNPVVLGKARSWQSLRKDHNRTMVMPVLIHGDAAFAGQGIVAETLMISELPGYSVGGTLHIVINNQIGFTTMPKYGRSGPYCTDVAKMLAAPIFHVNGDDPEATVHVARIATEFRQKFNKDVVVDMYCYRRYGHNEGDEPSFTQPKMYKKIAETEPVRQKYFKQLSEENLLNDYDFKKMEDELKTTLEYSFASIGREDEVKASVNLSGKWENFIFSKKKIINEQTGATQKDISEVGKTLGFIPDSFNLHPKLERFIESRKKMFDSGEGVDWSTAEALAFGTLLREGYRVRLSGQDSGRGTFSQRHAIFYDQETEEKYIQLQHIEGCNYEDVSFEVHDSPLSEFAVLGFEYGYSRADPMTLPIWEAQFGDFANGAQVIIDQFIAAGELKWTRMSGLVMLLPHGYEGQGPEHSSARLERFLQLSGENNWQVCNCTTPANYFHILRRQMHRNFRKPLIIMSPKSLLRHKFVVSNLSDMTGDTYFLSVLPDDDFVQNSDAKKQKVRKIVLCSGKIYYDLLAEKRGRKIKDVAIVRLEQLFPFPEEEIISEISKYCKNIRKAKLVWCQEEPENQGAWWYIAGKFRKISEKRYDNSLSIEYVGRKEMAATAEGLTGIHSSVQKNIIDNALS